MGPGFPWTLTVSPAQQEALAWVRTNTPDTASCRWIQWSAAAATGASSRRLRSVGWRRGLPISLLPDPGLSSIIARGPPHLRSADPARAHDIARELRIDYLWVDDNERRAYQGGVAAIDAAPGYFKPVFRNSEVAIYQVR